MKESLVTVTVEDLERLLPQNEVQALQIILGSNIQKVLAELPQPPEQGAYASEEDLQRAMLEDLKLRFLSL